MEQERLFKKEAATYMKLSIRQLQRIMAARRITFQTVQTNHGPATIFERSELDRVMRLREQPNERPRLAVLCEHPARICPYCGNWCAPYQRTYWCH